MVGGIGPIGSHGHGPPMAMNFHKNQPSSTTGGRGNILPSNVVASGAQNIINRKKIST